jgi:outer membrane receptor protein involved in Fe transport
LFNLILAGIGYGQIIPHNPEINTGGTSPIHLNESFDNIQVITSDEIELLNFQSLNDVLQYSLNYFSVYEGKDGYSLNYFGTDRKHIKVLLNGLPLFQTSIDFIDLSKISLLDVKQVEILTGSNSVYNGSNAALATINIITEQRANKVRYGKVNMNTSSKGDLNAFVKGGLNFGRHNANVTYGQFFFSGVGGTDSFRVFQWKPRLRQHLRAHYTYRLLNELDAFVSVNHIRSKVQDRGYPIPNTLRAYDTDQLVNNTIVHAGIKGKISKYHTIDFSHSYTNYALRNHKTIKILSDLNSTVDDKTEAFDHLHYDEYFNQVHIAKNSKQHKFNYDAGLEFSHQRDLRRTILRAVKTNITQISVLGKARYTVNEDFALRGGLRYINSNRFHTKPIFEGGFNYQMSDSATLLMNYSNAFRTPSFNEMFYTFENPGLNISGNLNLQSETFNQFSTTLKIKSNRVLVYTNLFWINSQNNIELQLIDSATQQYQFNNNRSSKIMGQSVNISRNGERLNVLIAANNIGINQYPEELGNYYFSQEILFKLSYKLETAGMVFTSAGKFTGTRDETRRNSFGELEDYEQSSFWLVDISVKKRLFQTPFYALIGLKNMTNTFNVASVYRPVDRFSDDEINREESLSIDYGRRYWFSILATF